MGRVDGKVALITGAARGQGRSHAVRLAEEGADIIAIDNCADLATVSYPGPTEEELDETAALVKGLGRRVVTAKVDVRHYEALAAAVNDAVTELGHLDIVNANAGIGSSPYRGHEIPPQVWQEMIDINLTGVWHTCKATIPHMLERGGSIILTSSVAGLRPYANIAHYVAAKHGVVGLMRSLAVEYGPYNIRVNTINPTQVDTPMIMNDAAYRLFRPDLESPTREDMAEPSQQMHVLPIPWVDPIDVSNAVLFLASDESRYVTGVALPVDAGNQLK